MYIGLGTLRDLVEWFDDRSTFRYLLLFVGGSETDPSFFGSVVDGADTLDFVSDEEILIYLPGGVKTAVEFRPPQEGHLLYLPGQVLGPSGKAFSLEDRAVNRRVTEIELSELRNDLIRASTTFGEQIRKEFALSEREMPSMILLYRGHPTPLIVRTRGQADFESVLRFLKQLKGLKPSYALKAPKETKRTIRMRQEGAIRMHARANANLDATLEAWRRVMEVELGADRRSLAQLVRSNAMEVAGEMLGAELDGPGSSRILVPEIRGNAAAVEATKSVLHRAKTVAGIEVELTKLRRAEHLVKRELDDLDGYLADIDARYLEASEIAGRFESQFLAIHGWQAFKSIINEIAGLVKPAKDIADLRASVVKSLGEGGAGHKS